MPEDTDAQLDISTISYLAPYLGAVDVLNPNVQPTTAWSATASLTHSFQAPDFYKKQGYQEFGRLADFPPGHSLIWFSKTL